ncbi:MAG TPA: nuclear transport factor 2 family protein [Gemmatimonadales bacterium]|nr:nuclear transport factor 2 family protein [Gemmatimonadales bacterium]
MTRPHMGFLIVAALLASPSAQTPSVRDLEAQAVLRLEDDWAVGLSRRDVGVFRRLLAQGFVYTEDDRTVGRDDVLHDIVAGPDTVQAAHNEDMHVRRFGATAIVTGWLVVSGRGTTGPFQRRYRFTDTWVRGGRGGGRGWQIVAAQDYLVPTR